jgi:hypothetical protein
LDDAKLSADSLPVPVVEWLTEVGLEVAKSSDELRVIARLMFRKPDEASQSIRALWSTKETLRPESCSIGTSSLTANSGCVHLPSAV